MNWRRGRGIVLHLAHATALAGTIVAVTSQVMGNDAHLVGWVAAVMAAEALLRLEEIEKPRDGRS